VNKIGLLWDSLSNNMGDQAIGLFMQRTLGYNKINYSVINPVGKNDLRDVVMLIIGGGELIRSPGHHYYDAFRVPGSHILNTVGVLDGEGTEYLQDYSMVAVRSKSDQEKIGFGEVAPCLTILYEDYLPNDKTQVNDVEGAIGIHLTYAFHEHITELVEWICAEQLSPIVWIPVTYYNADRELMKILVEHVPGSRLLPVMSPDDVYRSIGQLRGLISSSLHAMLFAYVQSIPFMGLGSSGKIRSFLVERGLNDFMFHNAEDIRKRFLRILEAPSKHKLNVEVDQSRCRDVLSRIIEECKRAIHEDKASSIRLPTASETYHSMEMRLHNLLGKQTAALINQQLTLLDIQRVKFKSQYDSLSKEYNELEEKIQIAKREAESAKQGIEIAKQEVEIAKREIEIAKRETENAKQEIKASQEELSITRQKLNESTADLQKVQHQLHLEGTKHSKAVERLQEMLLRFADLRSSPEGRVLLGWLVRKEIMLPQGSLRRRVFDRLLLFPLSIRLSLIRLFQRLANLKGVKQFALWLRGGKLSPLEIEKYGPLHVVAEPEYGAFVRRFEPRPEDMRNQELSVNSWLFKPKISLITVVVDVTEPIFDQTVSSILNQSYEHWIWYLVDASTLPKIKRHLQDLEAKEPRVRYLIGKPEEDISANRRLGLRWSNGDYVALFSARDTLAPHALYTVADLARQNSEIDLIYSDHDELDELSYRTNPCFKPDWSPEMLLSTDYLAPFCVFKRNLIEKLEDTEFVLQGPGMWDFHLHLSELCHTIQHIPEILCHERGASIFSFSENYETFISPQEIEPALRNHLVRSGLKDVNVSADPMTSTTIRWKPSRERRISIIIPSRDKPKLVRACLKGLFDISDYQNFQVVLVDTGSVEEDTFALYEEFSSNPQFKLVKFAPPFNFSKACNFGAANADGELLLFLNNDTEVIESIWLRSMSQWFDRKGVGVVGAQLLYPDGTLQHSGVVVGFGGLASHLFEGKNEDISTIFGRACWYRNLSAVTAACMLVSREAFEAVEGFDEGYQLNYSDVDLCIKIRKAGWRIVFSPDVRLVHHESRSHGRRIPRSDFERASQRWFEAGFLQGDPYFNPNLSYMSTYPVFRRTVQDNPLDLNRRLMSRLPHKEFLQLPDDLS
jgi:GT2 family glycosyltransferase